MRRLAAAALGATALALPSESWATALAQATAPKPKVVTRSFTGAQGQADRWGYVEVTLVVRKTTTTNATTGKKTVKRRITAIKVPVYPNHTDRSVFINQQALPLLVQETISAQSAKINVISGATNTSDGFYQSLQSALLKEKAW